MVSVNVALKSQVIWVFKIVHTFKSTVLKYTLILGRNYKGILNVLCLYLSSCLKSFMFITKMLFLMAIAVSFL